jgi:hypothetical protein
MKEIIEKNMLKYEVGTQMFCPLSSCQKSLDVSNAVSVTTRDKDDNVKAHIVTCGECHDRLIAPKFPEVEKAGLSIEVLDGRKL